MIEIVKTKRLSVGHKKPITIKSIRVLLHLWNALHRIITSRQLLQVVSIDLLCKHLNLHALHFRCSQEALFCAYLKIDFPLGPIDLVSCVYSPIYRLSGYAKANSPGTCWFNYGLMARRTSSRLRYFLCVRTMRRESVLRIRVHRGRQSTLTRSYKRGIGDYYMLSSTS